MYIVLSIFEVEVWEEKCNGIGMMVGTQQSKPKQKPMVVRWMLTSSLYIFREQRDFLFDRVHDNFHCHVADNYEIPKVEVTLHKMAHSSKRKDRTLVSKKVSLRQIEYVYHYYL